MKVAIVSHILPPSWSGQAVMLYRILRDVPADCYCLVLSGKELKSGADPATPPLPGRLYEAPPVPRPFRSGRIRIRPDKAVDVVDIPLQIMARARKIADVIRRERCGAVVACTGGDLLDLPAGYCASRMTRTAFYPYIFDDYISQWEGPYNPWRLSMLSKPLGRMIEAYLMRHARGIIVPNEFMARLLAERYGVRSAIVRNPCDTAAYDEPLPPRADPDDSRAQVERRIVYTGAVYEAHYDSFVRLIRAIDALGRPGLKLHLYTAQSASALESKGILGPIVVHGHVGSGDVPAIQRRADVLFLPLAFTSPYPAMLRTAAPGKLGEYLAARRPVLVHAPADSFPAWYFRQNRCGLVVESPDANLLAQALGRILDDGGLRRELTENAGLRAESDFTIAAARAAFCRAVGIGGSGLLPDGSASDDDACDRPSALAVGSHR